MQTQCQMNIFALLKCRMHKKSYAPLFRCFRFVFIYSIVGCLWFGSVRVDSFRYEPIWCVQLRITCDWFVWGWLVFYIKNKLKLQNWIFIIWWILNQISCLSTWLPERWLKIIYMHKTEQNRTEPNRTEWNRTKQYRWIYNQQHHANIPNTEHFISTYRCPLFISDHNNNALNREAYSILCVAQISAIFRIWIELNSTGINSSRTFTFSCIRIL